METKVNMVETLDDLLDSIEDETKTQSKQTKLIRSELSVDISDLLALDLDDTDRETKGEIRSEDEVKIKCCPVILDGQKTSEWSRYTKTRLCTALYCRNCDFSVKSYPNHEWMEDVDYIFLRTEMPNFEKVSKKLKQKAGVVAYACHCVSFTSEKVQPLPINSPWFCRGH